MSEPWPGLRGGRSALVVLIAGALAALTGAAKPQAWHLVTDVPEMSGFQAQDPVFAPGTTPRLVHSMSDRADRAWLRIVDPGAASTATLVGVTGGSRLSSLGDGSRRSDTAAAFWDSKSLFFVRATGLRARLHFWDGHARAVGPEDLRILEMAADGAAAVLVATMEVGTGVDLGLFSGGDVARPALSLTKTPEEVEHSLVLDAKRRVVRFIASSRESSTLRAVDFEGRPVGTSVHGGAAGLEFVSIAAVPGSLDLLAFARPQGATAGVPHHMVEVLASGAIRVLAKDVFLPPGLAPPPAVTADGGRVLYVAHDAPRGNPIVEYDRLRHASAPLVLPTRGHQQVAVGSYPGPGGAAQDWVAVVCVGGEEVSDVRNHLYAGPLVR